MGIPILLPDVALAPCGSICDVGRMGRQLLLAAGLGAVLTGAGLAAFPGTRRPADFERDIKPVIEKHCASCHGEKKQRAGLTFAAFQNTQDVRRSWRIWLDAGRKIAAREMPPEDSAQPTAAERELILSWLARDMFPVDERRPDPGHVTLRRLNRTEYNNTIRDLVGVDFRPADDFPADDLGYGFDNNGDVLTVSPLLLEKYLAAAEQVVDRALARPDATRTRLIPLDALRSTNDACRLEGAVYGLYREGVAATEGPLDEAGEYRIRVTAYGEMAGDEPPRMAVRIDGRDVQRFDVTVTEDAAQVYECTARLAAGPHRLGIAYLNNFRDPENRDPRRRDRNLFLTKVEIAGPLGAPPPAPSEAYRRLFARLPDPGLSTNEFLRQALGAFAGRAYRRPATADELAALTGFAQRRLGEGVTLEDAVRGPLIAILVSPHFLFRGEAGTGTRAGAGPQLLDEYTLASRLSYFLWSSMPDDALFALAGQGKLRAQLDGQVARMLQDPKARALAENFAGQWLQIRNLDVVRPDARLFPDFDDELRQAMRRETELFVADIFQADRSVLDFVQADYTFVNERLATFYGLAGVTGPAFRRVSLRGTPRGGVFTQAGVLTVTSNPTRTSPVKRGKWVLENLLAAAPPPPPPDVPPFQEQAEGAAQASLRERMLAHRTDPVCASCHVQMDPIGFAFEHFDAIGRWRERDGAFPIDDSCTLRGAEPFHGTAGLRAVLATQRRDQFVHALAEKLLTYALGRGLDYYDMPAVDRICRNVAQAGYRSSALVRETVASVPFQMRRGDAAAAVAAAK